MSSRRRSKVRIWLCAGAALALGAGCPALRASGKQDKTVPPPCTAAVTIPPSIYTSTPVDAKDPIAVRKLKEELKAAQDKLKSVATDESRIATECNGFKGSLAKPASQTIHSEKAVVTADPAPPVTDNGVQEPPPPEVQPSGPTQGANQQQTAAAQQAQDSKTSPHLGSRLSLMWLAPAASALLSLFAILWVIYERKRMKALLTTAESPSNALKDRVKAAEDDLEERKKKEDAAAPQHPARSPIGAVRGAAPPAAKASRTKLGSAQGVGLQFPKTGVNQPVGSTRFSAQSDELAAKIGGLQSDAKDDPSSDAAPDPLPTPANLPPVPLKPTGDIVTDYNTARSMGDNGPDWFKTAYHDWLGLSCTNTSDLLINPKAVPLFQLQDQGSYLGVNHRGVTRLVPALEWDLAASAPHMKGIFETPSTVTDSLLLQKEALIEQNGDLWKLNAKGVIQIG